MNEDEYKRKFTVRLEFTTTITHRDIEAHTEEEAIQIAHEWTDGNLISLNSQVEDEIVTAQ